MLNLSFDLNKTKALLIGVSDYQSLRKIAPAINNVADLTSILSNERIIGLPEKNIIPVINAITQAHYIYIIVLKVIPVFSNDRSAN